MILPARINFVTLACRDMDACRVSIANSTGPRRRRASQSTWASNAPTERSSVCTAPTTTSRAFAQSLMAFAVSR